MAWTVLAVLLLGLLSRAAHSQELKYALFTSGPDGGFHTSGVVPAFELAEEIINGDSSILSGYNLTHTPVVDTKCDRTESLSQYFETVYPPNPTVLGLLGCGCSVASTPVAEIVSYNSISQIAYVSSSIELSDRKRFPNFFRTYPSDADFAPAIVTLIQEYNWRQIGFITQDEGLFTEAFSRISRSLNNNGITFDSIRNNMIPSSIPIRNINDTNFFFEDDDIRIFFLNTYSDIARQIICMASQRNYTYPRYVWLTYGWYEENWWTEKANPEPISCSDEDLQKFLHRSIVLQLVPTLNNSDSMTETRLTPREFESLYRMRINTPEARANNYTFVFLATVAYDALWTFARALNRTSEMVQSSTKQGVVNRTGCNVPGELVSLENFTYSNQFMGCIIRWNLERTDFVGISGRVTFNRMGTRNQPTVQLIQYRFQDGSLDRINFGQAVQNRSNMTRELLFGPGQSTNTVFPPSEGGTPPDGVPIEEVTTYHLALVIVYYVLSALGLIFTTVCLVFNFTQRNKKVVKLTSPNINYFVIIGAYIQYTSIFFRVLPSSGYDVNLATCFITSLFVIAGYCFGYGAILAKMGRIYYIFNNPTANKKTLKDWKLILVVLGVAGLGVFLAVLQIAVPPLRPTPSLRENSELGNNTMNELGVRIEYYSYQCYNSGNVEQSAMLAVLFIYLALLQIVGIILAIQTRKVKIKLLNDSKYIAALIYSSSLFLILIGVVSFTATNLPNIGEAIISGGLWIVTTLFLALIFVPKMVSLYRDPMGENVFRTSSEAHASAVRGMERTFTQSQSRILDMETSVMKDEMRPRIQSSQHSNGHSRSSLNGNIETSIALETNGVAQNRTNSTIH